MVSKTDIFYFYFYLLSIRMKSTFPIISINVFHVNVSNTRPPTYGNVSNFLVNSDRVQKVSFNCVVLRSNDKWSSSPSPFLIFKIIRHPYCLIFFRNPVKPFLYLSRCLQESVIVKDHS